MTPSMICFSRGILIASWLLLACNFIAGGSAFGLNLCSTSYGTDCCPGWRRDATRLCSIPVCDGDCGSDGHCVGPNLCYCPDGVIQYSCDGTGPGTSELCPSACLNGGRCKGGLCECPSGFSGSTCQFATCPSQCSGHGQCLSSGVCSCDEGFSGPACDVVDKGLCYSGVSSTGVCTGRLSSVYISREECCNSFGKAWGTGCRPCRQSGCGFGRVSMGRTCAKLNFCDIPGICGGDVCIMEGDNDVTCLCSGGLTYNTLERRCEKQQNFCDSHLGVCGIGGSCINDGSGSYKCQCFPGYDLRSDGKYCSERAPDPCSVAAASPCGQHGTCVSLGGSGDFRCRCDAGYEASVDGRACVRQTYCSVNPSACSPGGECVPVDDFFYCRCRQGYRVTPSGLDCLPEPPPTTTTLRPTPTTTTTPEDACRNQRSCPPEVGDCLHLTGDEFFCACKAGFRHAKEGSDIRTCEPAPLADAPAVTPTPSPTRPQRLYCDERPSTCANGRCVSISETDFYCSCSPGYKQADDRRSCVSERESAEINPCLVFDICRNGGCSNLGSGAFQCFCYRGFQLTSDRQNCELSRPPPPTRPYCERVKTACRPNGVCVSRNTTDYVCACNPGYDPAPDRRSCRSKRRTSLAPEVVPTGFPIPQDPLQRLFYKSYCQKFSYVCGRGLCLDLDGSHQFTCACASGYRLSYDKRFCVKADLRETGYCAEHPDACAGTGHCVNAPGTQLYQCFCYPGFRNSDAERRRCQAYDYNADTNKVVIHGVNSGSGGTGSSSSSSSSGGGGYAHLGSPDSSGSSGGGFHIDGSVTVIGSKNRESDGGYANLGGGSGACHMVVRSADGTESQVCQNGWCVGKGADDYECGCRLGFKAAEDKRSCIDVDECQVAGSDLCLMGRCINTIGSYTCDCRQGFKLDNSNKLCRDRDECLETPSLCTNGECVNLWGGFECLCRSGYRHSNASRIDCVPAPANSPPDFNIDATITVQHLECPDCIVGCRQYKPYVCRCPMDQTLLAGVVCAPLKSRLVSSSSEIAAGRLQIHLPTGMNPKVVRTATRKVKIENCSVLKIASPRYNLVQCSIANSSGA